MFTQQQRRLFFFLPQRPVQTGYKHASSNNPWKVLLKKRVLGGGGGSGGGEGGVTLCDTQGTYQIVMSVFMLCFTRSNIFSDEQWAWGEGQAWKKRKGKLKCCELHNSSYKQQEHGLLQMFGPANGVCTFLVLENIYAMLILRIFACFRHLN